MRFATMRRATAATVLTLALGCGGSEPPAPATTTTTSTVPPAANPEEARRILQERGIDPDKLSEQIREQMRRRFQQAPAN